MTPDITLILTESQAEELRPIVRRQPVERKGLLLLATAAPHLDDGVPTLHLQIQFLSRSAASKILKIIHEDTNH
jgi:hypothetical protein